MKKIVLASAVAGTLLLAACGGGDGGGGGVIASVLDAFTSAVADIIATTSEAIEAVSIDALALVTSETAEPATFAFF